MMSNQFTAFVQSLTDDQLEAAVNAISWSPDHTPFEQAIETEFQKREAQRAAYVVLLHPLLISGFLLALDANTGADQPDLATIWEHFQSHLGSRLATQRLLPGWTPDLEAQTKKIIVHIFAQIRNKEQS